MIKLLRLVVLLAVISISQSANSQCIFGNNNFPTGIITPTSATWTAAATNVYAGEYSMYNVTLGNTYEWSTCAANGGLAEYDSQLTLWRSTNTTTAISYADDECGSNELLTWTATFTGTVYVQLNEYDCLTNSTPSTLVYRRSAFVGGAPANDLCSNATTINLQTNCNPIAATIQNATGSTPVGCLGTANDDVWFRLVSNGTGDIYYSATPNGTGFDPVIEVFSGSCAAPFSFACRDDGGDGVFEEGGVTGVTAGDVIWVRVYHYYSTTSTNPGFTFCAEQAAPVGITGDDCTNAISLVTNLECQPTAGNLGAFTATTNPVQACTGTLATDSWYTFTANADTVLFTADPSGNLDLVLEIYEGTTCGALSFVGCADYNIDGIPESVVINGTSPGTRFYIRVYDYYGNANSLNDLGYTVCAHTINSNLPLVTGDDCSNAIPLTTNLTCTPTAGNLGNFTATTTPAQACPGTLTSDVWYTFTASADSVLFAAAPSGDLDLVLEIYVGSSCGTMVFLGCADYTLSGEAEAIVINSVTPGTRYYVRMYDYFGNANSLADLAYNVCAFTDNSGATPPANDDCAGAINITAGTTCNPIAGTMLNATASAPTSGCGGTNNEDVWYQVIASDTAVTVEITPDFSTLGIVAEVFVPTAVGNCTNMISIGCIDNTLAGLPEAFTVTGMLPGQSFYVRIYDFLTAPPVNPTFTICAYWNPQSLTPTNDECAGAVALTASSTCNPVNGTTLNATGSAPSSSCSAGGVVQADVWYSFVATATSANVIVTPTGTMDAVVQYFSGSCANLVSRGCSDFFVAGGAEQLSATGLVIGQTYYVRVFDYFGLAATSNTFSICIQNNVVPTNDNCAGAMPLALNANITWTLTDNALATQSLVGCTGNANDDVWFSFVAGANPAGTTIYVYGDLDYQSVFQVFSGSCSNLTSIICENTDVTGPYYSQSASLTTLTPGQTYYVRVYNFDASTTNSTFYIAAVGTPVGCNLTAPTVSASGSSVLCSGGSVNLSAPNVAGLTYQWLQNGIAINGAIDNSYSVSTAGNYGLFVTNAQGCTATSNSIDVIVGQTPTATITAGGSTTICGSGSVTLSTTAQTGSTYQWLNSGTPINGATSLTYSATASGSYSLRITNAAGCQGVSNSISVNVVAAISATISNSGNNTICQGSSSILNVNTQTGNTIQWRLNGNPISGATSASYTATQAGAYTAYVSNGPTCNATSNSITLTVVAGPNASITAAGATTFCQGNSVTLNVGSVSGASYQWLQNGSLILGANGTSYSANEAGSYTALVTTVACAATSNAVTVNVNSAPSSSIFANGPTTFCQGNSVVLNAPTGSGLTYQWFNNGNQIAGATSATYTASTTGNYVVSVTQNGCSGNSPATSVTVTPPPSSTISVQGNATVCQGNNVLLNGPTGSNVSYQWLLNGSAIQGAVGISYTASTSGNYSLTVSQGTSCSSTSNVTAVSILANPIATVTAAGPTGICQGGSVVLNSTTGAGYTYQWQINGATIPGATSSSYTASSQGDYNVVITNVSACTATSEAITVTVNAQPTATITANGPTTFCIGGTVLLQANSGNGFTYQWSQNGDPLPGVVNSVFNVNSGGSFTVTVTNQNGCSAVSAPIQVNVAGTASQITYTGNPAVCDGNAVVLNGVSGVGLSYQWQNNGADLPGADQSTYTASTGGNYTLVVSDLNNCVSTSSPVTITVGQTPPSPVVTNSGSTAICQGESIDLTYSVSAGLTYSWSSFGTPISGGTNGSLTVDAGGEYVLTGTNNSNCSASSVPVAITVNQLPTVTLTLDPDTICNKGELMTLAGGSPVGGVYTGTGVNAGVFTSPDEVGNVLVTYKFTDNNGCSNEATDFIKVVNCTGIDELNAPQLSLFPNPATNSITLTTNFSLRDASFELMDATGRLLQLNIQNKSEHSLQLSIDDLATGVYQLVVRKGDNVYTVKLVKTV
jgi:hypothetical protein